MKRPLTHLLAVLLLALATPAPAAEIAPEKIQQIEQLMTLTGAQNLGLQFGRIMTQQIYQVLKAAKPQTPDRALTLIEEETNALMAEESPALLASLVPIYDRHFTAAELAQLVAFYQTDLGKKTIEVMPMVMKESVAAGQVWGQKMAPKLMSRLEERFKQEKIELPEEN
jgi:uncharacterized protein